MLCLALLILSAYTVASMQDVDSYVNVCPGQPQTFTCEVPKQGSLTRLEWRIDFEDSYSMESVTQQYTSYDSEGFILRDDRSGVSFVFNLTSNSSPSLVSALTVTAEYTNATVLINNATVNCGDDDTYPKVLHAYEGPPSSQMNISRDLMKFKWNPLNAADHYIVSVSPPMDHESESTFITSNTTIQLHLQYNQAYNLSVMASNCAGNSTPTEISVRIGYCKLSTAGFNRSLMIINGNSSGVEGSQISFYCHDDESQPMVATCMSNGSWSPDPHMYNFECHKNETPEIISESDENSKMITWLVIVAITMFVTVVLIVIVSTVLVLKVCKRHFSQKMKVNHSNFYSNVPSSEVMNENQELGIYSLLQSEEKTVARLQSTDQTAGLVYADVGSTLPRNNANTNIFLQLDDDCVQYADVKHHQQTEQSPEVHHREFNSDSQVDLDNLLIQLRSEVTPKWYQFGLAVGIPEEILKKYSKHPPEECMVEVFDYWLRNHDKASKPTWKDVANVLTKIELHQLAETLLQNGAPKPMDMNAVPEDMLQSKLQSSDEFPPPLPPKIADLDEEMMLSYPSTGMQSKYGCKETPD